MAANSIWGQALKAHTEDYATIETGLPKGMQSKVLAFKGLPRVHKGDLTGAKTKAYLKKRAEEDGKGDSGAPKDGFKI